MPNLPTPPQAYNDFSSRFPKLSEAWQLIGQAAKDGPLTEREVRLVKLGVAIGALREGAVHSNVRKGIAQGMARADLEEVVSLAADTIGFPSAVAVYTWVQDYFVDRASGKDSSLPPV
jgi:alkylhydroperoxidase/carboxymuconolactone decarboxylase family protein YurZ